MSHPHQLGATVPRIYPTTSMCNGEILAAMEPLVRPTDVFTSTIAKCGQTWLTALLYHLKTGGHSPTFDGKKILGVVPWLELPYDATKPGRPLFDVADRIEHLEGMDNPRVFKMHVVWDEIPRPPGNTAPVITITRDPRDVPYSMYKHLCGLKNGPFEGEPPPFEVYFERWFELGFYFKFVDSFWPHRHDPDVLWLRYEDLSADLEQQARRILDFLGWSTSEEELQRALSLVDFRHMQRAERTDVLGPEAFTKGRFFREGGTGKNRAKLTDEMERRIVERIRERYSAECAEFLLALG